MKKIIFFLFTCSAIFSFSSCGGKIVHITGDFYATEVDSKEDRRLSRVAGEDAFVGVLRPMVVATWTNGKVIITKQHPTDEFYCADYSHTEYYIVIIGDNKYGLNDSIIGPLSEEELKLEKKTIGVPEKIRFVEID